MAADGTTAQITVDVAGGTLTLTYPEREAVRHFFAEARVQQGFMVPFAEKPKQFATMAVTVTDPGGFELTFPARVVQIFDKGGVPSVAFVLADWPPSRDVELERKLAAAPAGADESERTGVSPAFRIRELDPGARMRLAMKADRAERQILCRDPSPPVLLSLLANPRLEPEEVLAIVKSTSATGGILERVAADRRWMSSPEIRTAVVRNPKTPTPLAVRLLDTLPITELRDMAKMGSIREDVRRAAFRVYEKRSSRG
jgi:hypothetical protein